MRTKMAETGVPDEDEAPEPRAPEEPEEPVLPDRVTPVALALQDEPGTAGAVAVGPDEHDKADSPGTDDPEYPTRFPGAR